MYADYEYYIEQLCGKEPSVPEETWGYWERMARLEIDAATHGRSARLTTLPDNLKECVCAVAEVLYRTDVQSQSFQEQGLAGPLQSWANDGQSGTVALGESIYTESGKNKEIGRLLRLYLAGTGLLYAGVMHLES